MFSYCVWVFVVFCCCGKSIIKANDIRWNVLTCNIQYQLKSGVSTTQSRRTKSIFPSSPPHQHKHTHTHNKTTHAEIVYWRTFRAINILHTTCLTRYMLMCVCVWGGECMFRHKICFCVCVSVCVCVCAVRARLNGVDVFAKLRNVRTHRFCWNDGTLWALSDL